MPFDPVGLIDQISGTLSDERKTWLHIHPDARSPAKITVAAYMIVPRKHASGDFSEAKTARSE